MSRVTTRVYRIQTTRVICKLVLYPFPRVCDVLFFYTYGGKWVSVYAQHWHRGALHELSRYNN